MSESFTKKNLIFQFYWGRKTYKIDVDAVYLHNMIVKNVKFSENKGTLIWEKL